MNLCLKTSGQIELAFEPEQMATHDLIVVAVVVAV
jgi:hypothetical protein